MVLQGDGRELITVFKFFHDGLPWLGCVSSFILCRLFGLVMDRIKIFVENFLSTRKMQ